MNWERLLRKELEPMSAYKPGLRASQVQKQVGDTHVCKLSSNESPYLPSVAVQEAIVAAISNLNEYPDGSCEILREAVSKYYGVKPDELIFGNGSNSLLNHLAIAMLNPGDEIVFPWPSFVVYDTMARMVGAKPVRVPTHPDGHIDVDGLLDAVTDKTKAIILCNPNNPTATVLSSQVLDDFMARVPEDILVIFDEAYIEFSDEGSTKSGLAYFDGEKPVLVFRTFSKAYGLAGLRCGFAIAPAILIETLDKVRTPFNVTTLSQVACTVALGEQEELARRVALNRTHRELMHACLDDLGIWHSDSQANFIALDTGNADKAFDELLSRGIITRKVGGPGRIRITVGDEAETHQVIEAFKEIFDQGPLE